jgi:hypothetical protein
MALQPQRRLQWLLLRLHVDRTLQRWLPRLMLKGEVAAFVLPMCCHLLQGAIDEACVM